MLHPHRKLKFKNKDSTSGFNKQTISINTKEHIMKNITLFVSACPIFILLAFIYGCHHKGTMLCGPVTFKDRAEMITERLSKDLDLTDEQKNHLSIIKDEMNAKLPERKKHIPGMVTAIREEIQKDSVDQQRLEKLFDYRKQFREDMHRFMIKKFVEFHAMLTKEQRIKLNVLIEKMGNQCIEE
jgi:protein CpxP